MALLNSLEREWPNDDKGPVASLANNHQPYKASIWERLSTDSRRKVLQFTTTLKKGK